MELSRSAKEAGCRSHSTLEGEYGEIFSRRLGRIGRPAELFDPGMTKNNSHKNPKTKKEKLIMRSDKKERNVKGETNHEFR